jgi:hypothetical protein
MSTNPFLSGASFKTLVIAPGETQVIKKSWNILKTINEGDVTVTSNCSDIADRLNATSEDLVEYALSVETADDLVGAGGTEDFLTGVGTNSTFYPFSSPISLVAFHTTDSDTAGAVLLYKAMVAAFPSGQVLLRDASYLYGNWAGPSGSTAQDNVYRASVVFKSFPSIIEDLGFYLLYKNDPTHGGLTTPYNMRIYPARTSETQV